MKRARVQILAWAAAVLIAATVLSAAFAANDESPQLSPRAFAPALACDSCAPEPTPTPTRAAATPTRTPNPGPTAWYTSSHSSAKYYYCSLDDGWRGLDQRYLREYPSEAALLADWSGKRTKHPDSKC